MKKKPQNKKDTFWIFKDFHGVMRVQSPTCTPHGIAISGFTNAEIIICCYVFKYFVLTDLYSLSLRENLLNFNGTYVVGSNHLKVF